MYNGLICHYYYVAVDDGDIVITVTLELSVSLFSYLSDMTHFGVRSSLQKCLYFDLSFILRVLTSAVH